MRPVTQFVKYQVRELTPVVIYFFIAFNILGLTRILLLREHGIRVSTFASATFGALLVAKAIILVEFLPFLHPFPTTPILYNAVWKTLIYWLAAVAVQVFDNTVVARFRYHAEPTPLSEMFTSPRFWVIQMWLVLLLLAYAVFRELTRALGPEKTREIFLGRRGRRHATDGPGPGPAVPTPDIF